MRISVIIVATALALPAYAPRVAAAPTATGGALQPGIRAFQRGEFAQALSDFQNAQRAGLDSPALHYNLGATYYKLHRDQQAEAEFRSLLRDPKFGDFSRYDLGLIARRSGRAAAAREYFSAVAFGNGNAHLRALARAELRASSPVASRWQGTVELDGGYNDNVTLAGHQSLIGPSGAGSAATSAFVSIADRVSGDAAQGLSILGSLYDIKYLQQSRYDLLVARAGPEYRFSLSNWRLQSGANAAHIRLGTIGLESLFGINARAEHELGGGRLRLDYALTRVGGDGNYQYLTGWQQQFGVHTAWQAGPVQFTVGYGLGLNRRRDLAVGSEFFSVSSRRNQFDAELHWSPTAKTTLYASSAIWRSRYADPNIFLHAGTLVTLRRIDIGREAAIGALYRFGTHWRVGAQYGYRSNDSTVARYTYTSRRYLLRFQYFY